MGQFPTRLLVVAIASLLLECHMSLPLRSRPWLIILNDACSHYKVFVMEFDMSYDPEFGDPDEDYVGIKLGNAVSFKTENSSKVNVSLHNTTIAH